MTMQLTARVSALEAEVRDLRKVLSELIALMSSSSYPSPSPSSGNGAAHPNPQGPRQMCPKCGEKPAYKFHVDHCTGKKAAQ
jgi:hypothetical protein